MHRLNKLWIIVLLLLNLFAVANAEIIVPYIGSFGITSMYTPENKFESGYHLNIALDRLRLGKNNLNIFIDFAGTGVNEGEVNYPYYPKNNTEIPFSIRRIYIRNRNPLIPGLKSGTLNIGTSVLAYSDYTIYLNNKYARSGFSLINLGLGNNLVNGFLIWPDAGDLNSTLHGIKVDRKIGRTSLTGIFTQYSKPDFGDERINVEELKSLEFSHGFGVNDLSALIASQKTPVDIKRISQYSFITKPNDSSDLKITWRDFEPGYRPVFCNHTERYYARAGTQYNWNPVDRYAGWLGVSVEMDMRLNNALANINKEQYINRDYYRDGTNIPAEIGKEEASINGNLLGYEYLFSYSQQRVEVQNNNINNEYQGNCIVGRANKIQKNISTTVNKGITVWVENSNELYDAKGLKIGSASGFCIEPNYAMQINRGKFEGITLISSLKILSSTDFGSGVYPKFGFDYRPGNGLELKVRFTRPNYKEHSVYNPYPYGERGKFALDQYDRFGNLIELDNMVNLRYLVIF